MNLNFLNSPQNSFKFKTLKSEPNILSPIESYSEGISHRAKRSGKQDTHTVAGLTIFAFMLLRSWRKSKNEIRQLKQTLENLKNVVSETCVDTFVILLCNTWFIQRTRTETQLCIYGSLLKVEQSRTDELAVQLKRALHSLKDRSATCKSFSTLLCSLKIRQTFVEQEFKKKLEECEAMNEILAQTRTQLFRTMMEQRNLHLQLCNEQRLVQTLENEKKMLITKVKEYMFNICISRWFCTRF